MVSLQPNRVQADGSCFAETIRILLVATQYEETPGSTFTLLPEDIPTWEIEANTMNGIWAFVTEPGRMSGKQDRVPLFETLKRKRKHPY